MSMTFDRAKLLLPLAIIGILLMPVPVALANVPPVTLDLVFEYKISNNPDLEGVQFIGCESPECRQPTLLAQFGRCDSTGCLAPSSSRETVEDLACMEGTCLAVEVYYMDFATIPAHKVVGQFSDRVRESEVFSSRWILPHGGTDWTRTVQIVVQDTALLVSTSNPYFSNRISTRFSIHVLSNFVVSFLPTMFIELLVAAVALRGWLKIKGGNLLKGLGYVFFANLVSYPVTWLFWPSLDEFHFGSFRRSGFYILIFAAICTTFVVHLSRKGAKAQSRWMILTPVMLVAAVIITIFIGYHDPLASIGVFAAVQGLPANLTVALAEVFAVAFESTLIYLLARKTLSLSFKQAALIGLAMNASSFLAGTRILLVLGELLSNLASGHP